MGYIYMLKNKINGKAYIGQTKFDDDRRIKEHFCMANQRHPKNLPLYNAIRKYGSDNFDVTILKDNLDILELDYWEIYYIQIYDTFNNGYNNTLGGAGIKNFHHSDESKLKISNYFKSHPEIYSDPIRSAKISASNKGRPKSAEHRKKLSEFAKTRTAELNPFYGKSHSIETINRLRESHIQYSVVQMSQTDDYIATFKSVRDAATYISENNISNAKLNSIMYRLRYTCEGYQQTAYGFKWKFIEKCNDYPEME